MAPRLIRRMGLRPPQTPPANVPSAPGNPARSSIFTELSRFARRNTLAAAGGLVGAFIVFVAVAAPLLPPRDPLKADFRRMTRPPDAPNFFGTDQVGRGTLRRVVYGPRSAAASSGPLRSRSARWRTSRPDERAARRRRGS